MKRLIVTLLALAFLTTATAAIAADVVTYEASKGAVTFNHKAHGEKLGDCAKCHEGTPAKIAVDKSGAHGAVCKDCHKAMGGPTKCNDCHK
ncbi:cytochrome c3 family protein [Malonomonas rubra]|uniref:cytochrome c3 family protein n=1 Tax=Malonomonas rubra TaxID=57040 RepID=UPI0026EAE504|nr:cytochrome c3 family protein [Malonomonas rubra]